MDCTMQRKLDKRYKTGLESRYKGIKRNFFRFFPLFSFLNQLKCQILFIDQNERSQTSENSQVIIITTAIRF